MSRYNLNLYYIFEGVLWRSDSSLIYIAQSPIVLFKRELEFQLTKFSTPLSQHSSLYNPAIA